MLQAICVRCGSPKGQPWVKCDHCTLDPSSDDEALVRSVYLSTGRFQTREQQHAWSKELETISSAIRNGDQPAFDEAELRRLRRQKRSVDTVPTAAVWGAFARFLLPGVIFMLALFALAIAIRFIH